MSYTALARTATMNTDDQQHMNNNSNGNPPVGVDADPADQQIVEIPPHLSTIVWDSFKTYMLYPFMIAVAGSFGLSIGTRSRSRIIPFIYRT